MASGNDRWSDMGGDARRRTRDQGPRPRREDREQAREQQRRDDRPARPSQDQRRGAAPVPVQVPIDPELSGPPAPKLDTNDLLALAQMDPTELAAMLSGNLGRKEIEIGTKVTGTVTRVGRDTVFVDIGTKSEGQIERGTVPDARPGQELTAYVASMGEHGIELALTLSGRAAAEHLEEALASGLPVEGKVASRNSGGFEVRIGSARAFCPASMISRLPEVDMDAFVGQTLQFRVVETGDKVVVNRRVLQEEELETKAGEIWAALEIGQQHRGTVRSVQDFGFFVDIGGVDGLVPRREISWAGGADPRTAVRIGQAVEVVVIDIDQERRKITLSVKALENDPWHAVGTAFAEGGVYAGTVVRVEPFGAFVELAPGLQGLVHVSKLGGGAPDVGNAIDVRLLRIDPERRRLELAPVSAGETSTAASSDTPVSGTVLEVLRNGVNVQLADGRIGWLPEQEADLPAGTVLAQRYRRGRPVQARILRDDSRKPTLTVREALDEEERSWRSHQAKAAPAAKGGGTGFGTFGDLLAGFQPKK
ncbi:MAG: S1 RNA-binding domain-containing protein [Alphaproteobacteria bacterium]|nr:S1 RNA-binding domain-containing protein [Alphaproteobacteria bacterium]